MNRFLQTFNVQNVYIYFFSSIDFTLQGCVYALFDYIQCIHIKVKETINFFILCTAQLVSGAPRSQNELKTLLKHEARCTLTLHLLQLFRGILQQG